MKDQQPYDSVYFLCTTLKLTPGSRMSIVYIVNHTPNEEPLLKDTAFMSTVQLRYKFGFSNKVITWEQLRMVLSDEQLTHLEELIDLGDKHAEIAIGIITGRLVDLGALEPTRINWKKLNYQHEYI